MSAKGQKWVKKCTLPWPTFLLLYSLDDDKDLQARSHFNFLCDKLTKSEKVKDHRLTLSFYFRFSVFQKSH